MKVPTNPFPTGKPAKGTDRQRKEHKALKRLEGLNYTPQTARRLACVLRDLADGSSTQREAVLRAFSEIANER